MSHVPYAQIKPMPAVETQPDPDEEEPEHEEENEEAAEQDEEEPRAEDGHGTGRTASQKSRVEELRRERPAKT